VSASQLLLDKLDKLGKAQCNIDVCASFYDSFDPADCTYKPHGGGPRRVCTK
jgi:penicillin-binding protein 1A